MGKPTTRVDHLSSPSGEGKYDLQKCLACGARWIAPQESSRLSCRVGSVLDNLDIEHASFLFPCPVCELPGVTLKRHGSALDLDVEAVRDVLRSEGFRECVGENGLNPPGIFDESGEEWGMGVSWFLEGTPRRGASGGRRVTVNLAALPDGRLSWIRVSRWQGGYTSRLERSPWGLTKIGVELPLARRWPTDRRTLLFHLRPVLAWLQKGKTAKAKAAFVDSLLPDRSHEHTSS